MIYGRYENTIRFTAVVGKSMLHVSKTFIDMGATRKLGLPFSASFSVANLTTRLPLKYSIVPSKDIKLNKLQGELDGSEAPSARSKEKIQYPNQYRVVCFDKTMDRRVLGSPSYSYMFPKMSVLTFLKFDIKTA